MLFFKKKKQNIIPEYPYGFEIPETPDTVCSQKGLVCLMKGLLIFSAAYGTVGGVVTSFKLPCSHFLLFMILFTLSVLMAFLHYSRLLFNIFYPVIFAAFTYFIFTFRFMVNSGYQAFVNILQQTYGDYYLLDTYRESTEYFSDRAMTITFAAAFIGFFLILLLNIFISEYMSPVFVILLTFPIFQMGIYVEKMPSLICFILLIFSYFAVAVLRCSRHFVLPYRDKKWKEFKFTETDKEISYRYYASGRLFWQLISLLFVFALIIGMITLPMMTSSSNSRLSGARRSMDEYMQVLTQNGMSGFWDRYQATGGISFGRLGGVSSVRPDYQTDLTVTFVPCSLDTVYLKAYTGSLYTGSSWEMGPKDTILKEKTTVPSALKAGSTLLKMSKNDSSVPTAKLKVELSGADSSCYYIPYHAAQDMGIKYQLFDGGIYPDGESSNEYTLTYHPQTVDTDTIAKETTGPDTFDKTPYTQIPDELAEYLSTLHDQIGSADDAYSQAQLIYEFFRENYPYNMTPGITPMRSDFVQYFLETQKRGYCAHFASAGVMLLRSFGYPARYIEGYAVSLSDMTEGSEVQDAVYDEWYQGENPLGQTGVVEVPVTDGSAHAWAEIYIDNVGWIPFEFTPPSDADYGSDTYSAFWELFSGLFSLSGSEPDTVDNSSQTLDELSDTTSRFNRFIQTSVFRPLIIFLAMLVLGWLIYLLIRLSVTYGKMRASYQKGMHAPLVSWHYRRLCRTLQKKGIVGNDVLFILPYDLAKLHNEKIVPHVKKKDALPDAGKVSLNTELLQKCLFSENGITKEQADRLLAFLRQYKKALR